MENPNNAIFCFERVGGSFAKERLLIKTFKSSKDMHVFLSGPKNDWNKWREVRGTDKAELKGGKYVFAGGKYHNVKSLDASALAHI